jgi:peptidoglycan/LPS O-acetylase OafA/YrhL
MITAGRSTGKTMSVPGGLALSGAISMGITLLASLLLAKLLDSQTISWEQTGYWIMAMLFAAAFAGAKAAIGAIRRQRLVVTLMSAALYWGTLLCLTALFFGGNFDAVPETALVIIAGSGCAAMVSLPQKKRRGAGRRKRKL